MAFYDEMAATRGDIEPKIGEPTKDGNPMWALTIQPVREVFMADAILCVGGVYLIRNTANGKVYVGSAANIARRFSEHRNSLNAKRHHSQKLQRAWDKYGADCFEFLVIESIEEVPRLIEREQVWIDDLKSATKGGYNVSPTAGSPAGVRHSAQARANMSAAQKCRPPITDATRLKLSLAGVGRKLSPESIEKMAAAHRGVKRSAEVNAKNSAARLGRPIPMETREKMSAAAKGRVHTASALSQMANSKRGRPLSAEHRAALKAAHKGMTGRKHSPETIAKMAATQQRIAAERRAANGL